MYTLIEWGLSFALNYESGKVPEVPLKLKYLREFRVQFTREGIQFVKRTRFS